MLGVIGCQFLGRLGNSMFTYAFCRGYAERHGLQLQTDPWIGQKIFAINDPPIDPRLKEKRDENTLKDGELDFIYRSYSQRQRCVDYYTRSQVKEWFRFLAHIKDLLYLEFRGSTPDIVCHRRVGDYIGYGFPVVSLNSYYESLKKYDCNADNAVILSEETGCRPPRFAGELSFLPDFYYMMEAALLLRGNSTFSWWAATLGRGAVMSPIITGLKGGMEHDCEFVPGNWPRCCDLDFVENLHLKP